MERGSEKKVFYPPLGGPGGGPPGGLGGARRGAPGAKNSPRGQKRLMAEGRRGAVLPQFAASFGGLALGRQPFETGADPRESSFLPYDTNFI